MKADDRDKADPCLCCKSFKDSTMNFVKVMDLNNAGLVIYLTDNVNQNNETDASTTRNTEDVFIFHNTKNTDIMATDFSPEIEDWKITCVRCRLIMKNARKLLQKVPAINKNDIRGICDHCKLKMQPCDACKEREKMFLVKKEAKEFMFTKDRVMQWLSKVKKMLKDEKETKEQEEAQLRIDQYDQLFRRESARGIERNLAIQKRGQIFFTSDADQLYLSHPDDDVVKSKIFERTITDYHEAKETKVKEERERKYKEELKLLEQSEKEGKKKTKEIPFTFPTGTTKSETKEPKLKLEFKEHIIYKPETKEPFYKTEPKLQSKGSMSESKGYKYETKQLLSKFEPNKPKSVPKESKFKPKGLKSESKLYKSGHNSKPKYLSSGAKEYKSESKVPKAKSKESTLKPKQLQSDKEIRLKQQISKSGRVESKSASKASKLKPKITESKLKEPVSDTKAPISGLIKPMSGSKQISTKSEQKFKQKKPSGKESSAKSAPNESEVEPRKLNLEKDALETKQDVENKKKTQEEKNEMIPFQIQNELRKMREQKNAQFVETIRIPRRKLEAELLKEEQSTKVKEIKLNKIKMLKPSQNYLVLELVKLKKLKAKEKLKYMTVSQLMTPLEIEIHIHDHKSLKNETCPMCINSDLELAYECSKKKKDTVEGDIIQGQKIIGNITKKKENLEVVPLLFKLKYDEFNPEKEEVTKHPLADEEKHATLIENQTKALAEPNKGVIRYALSDRSFIEKGWTILPTEKVVRKMNVYRMHPAHPEFDWFEHNKNKRLMLYDTGERLAEFDDNGRGRWYYRNGRLALDYYDAEDLIAQHRFVIYSNGEPDERGRSRPYTILATFDYLGNGIVFDHGGKIRLKYNQTEGVILDRNIGPVSHWKWHTLNDPPVLQQVMIDTQMEQKDPSILKMGGVHDNKPRPENEEMLAIEFDNFIKEKSKKLAQTFKPFQIKMKALKINENFSLKVLDQASVYLIFRDGTINLKMNIGMILDHTEIIDIDTAEVNEVSSIMETLPARTDSLAELQNNVENAQRLDRIRTERERRLRPTEPCISADKLTAAVSRPIRHPLRIINSSSTTTETANCYCKSRKPSSNNVYYYNSMA